MADYAGPEIGVASTKAYTCQLAVLASLAIAARARAGTSIRRGEAARHLLLEVPRHMVTVLGKSRRSRKWVRRSPSAGRALSRTRLAFPTALEGALKLKEISYIHAEGYAAGEMKHGPIALIDRNVPVIVIAPHDELFEKTVSNMQEVMARGGKVVLISDRKGLTSGRPHLETIEVPEADPFITPLLYALPIQMLAYHTADRSPKGTETSTKPRKPRQISHG
jgi:glucosamine--fructose-6-phosphate aminotransferase (isomerizing)